MEKKKQRASKLLAKLIEQNEIEMGVAMNRNRRPTNTQECKKLGEAERWRDDVNKEIHRKIEKIHTSGLQDNQIRGLNDDINKRIQEKYNWEVRIRELGGPDYIRKIGHKVYAAAFGGITVPGTKGYRYFGKAVDLPGVKELFENATQMQEKITPEQLQNRVDCDYYGLRDEKDELLLEYERKFEQAIDVLIEAEPPKQQEFEEFLVKRRKTLLEQKLALF